MTEIPWFFSKMRQLRQLIVSHNRVVRCEWPHLCMDTLEELNLRANIVTTFDCWTPGQNFSLKFLNQSALQKVNLQDNQIEEISARIRNSPRLTHLYLAANKLHTISDGNKISRISRISEMGLITVLEVQRMNCLVVVNLGFN